LNGRHDFSIQHLDWSRVGVIVRWAFLMVRCLYPPRSSLKLPLPTEGDSPMSPHRFRRAVAVAALPMMVLAGCSGDSTGPGNDVIQQTEAFEIFSALMSVAIQGFTMAPDNNRTAFDGPSLALIRGSSLQQNTFTWTGTGNCQNGGTVAFNGQWTDNTNAQGTGTYSYTLVQVPSSCQVQTSGGLFTVQGDPNITWTWNYSTQNFQPVGNYTYSMEGGFRYSGAGSGSCDIDINYVFAVTGASGTVTGSMCGYSYNQSFGG
jgi:hypothetical protein